jgi:ABC-type uncharacterized transport system substrate-binding protein
MRRREFIAGLGGIATFPMAAKAQQPTLPLVGFLDSSSPDKAEPFVAAFREGLREQGYVERRNVAVEYRWSNEHADQMPALAADLVGRGVKVIVATGGTPSALAAKAATTTIPIVFLIGNDPVKLGLVGSLNRPERNVTGVTNITVSLVAKRLQLLHELLPNARSIAVLGDPNSPGNEAQAGEARASAIALGLSPIFLRASGERDIDAAFATLIQQRAQALLLTDSALFNSRREQLVTLTERHAIPAMFTFREFAAAGGLMSYASSLRDMFRLVGAYAGRVLKGEKPADMPVQQPTRFELVINLKTAKALGLTIPETLLATADEVIQ